MIVSPYFRNLRSAYFAEIDDLCFDSDGGHVLTQRLAQRRKEIDFLVHMLELSPEMVAVVFHKGFRFKSLAVMEHLVSLESDELPEWDSLADSIEMEPWTQALLAVVRKQPLGDWFLTVAAGLEYLYAKPEHSQAGAHDDADDHDNHGEGDDEAENEARIREEAGADWMVEQGFDRKE